jgi:hypothetical protein
MATPRMLRPGHAGHAIQSALVPGDERIRRVTDRSSSFKLKELANGTTIVRARIDLDGQDQPVFLNRFIDLRPDGPRLCWTANP